MKPQSGVVHFSLPELVHFYVTSDTARHLEEPTDIQAEILQAFGYKISGGVLQGV